MKKSQYKQLMEKLNLISKLLALNIIGDAKTKKEKILKLYDVGFTRAQITALLKFKRGTVAGTIGKERKKKVSNKK